MKCKIVVHGYLRDLVDDEIVLDAATPAELINGWSKTVKHKLQGLRQHVVRVVGHERPEQLYSPLQVKEIHLVPAMLGGKRGGFFRILLGAVVVAAGIALSMATGGAGLSLGVLTISPMSLIFSGVSMMLGGLLQLMSPAPSSDMAGVDRPSDPEASKYLGAPQNTVRIGTRIPLVYGLVRAYGHYISFDVDAVDRLAPQTPPPPPDPVAETPVSTNEQQPTSDERSFHEPGEEPDDNRASSYDPVQSDYFGDSGQVV